MPKWVNLLRLWLRHLWLRIVAEGSFETGRSRSFRGIFSFFDINFIFCGFIKKLKISHFQKSVFWDFLRTPAKNQKMFFPKIKPHGEPDNLILHTQPAQTHLCGYLHKKPKSTLGFLIFIYELPNFLYQGRFHLASLGLKPPGFKGRSRRLRPKAHILDDPLGNPYDILKVLFQEEVGSFFGSRIGP